jgi:hypothetical protein
MTLVSNETLLCGGWIKLKKGDRMRRRKRDGEKEGKY